MKKSVILFLLVSLVSIRVFTIPSINRLRPHQEVPVLQAVIVDDLLLSRSGCSIRAFCLGKETPHTQYSTKDPTHMSLSLGGALLWAGTKQGSVQSLYRGMRAPVQTIPVFDVAISTMALPEDSESPYMYVAGGSVVKCVDRRMGKSIESEASDVGGHIKELHLVNPNVVLATSHNQVFVLNLKKGEKVAERTFPSLVRSLSLASDDGQLFCAATSKGSLYHVNTFHPCVRPVVIAGEKLQEVMRRVSYDYAFQLSDGELLTAKSHGHPLTLRRFGVVDGHSSTKKAFLAHDVTSLSEGTCGGSPVVLAGGPEGEVSLVSLDGFKKNESDRSELSKKEKQRLLRAGRRLPFKSLETIPE